MGNILSNKNINLLEGLGTPLSLGITGPTGSIYVNRSDGGLWLAETAGSSAGWSQTGTTIYTSDGQLTGDRSIDTNGNGIVIYDSTGSAYLDFHAAKGAGAYSIGTTFGSWVDSAWCGSGTNSYVGAIYAEAELRIHVGEPGNDSGQLLMTGSFIRIRPSAPISSADPGADSYSLVYIDYNANGASVGSYDTSSVNVMANGGDFRINDGGNILGAPVPNISISGNNLWVNSQGNTSGGYTSGTWGPNKSSVIHCFLWSQTTDATLTTAKLKGNFADVDGIPIKAFLGTAEYNFGQYEFHINMMTENGLMTSWILTGAFKTNNGTAAFVGSQVKNLVCDENGASADVIAVLSPVAANKTHLSVNVTGLAAKKCVWSITCKLDTIVHDISAIF